MIHPETLIAIVHHHVEVNLVSWRLEVSEIELTHDDTENVMFFNEQNRPCFFADGFCEPTINSFYPCLDQR